MSFIIFPSSEKFIEISYLSFYAPLILLAPNRMHNLPLRLHAIIPWLCRQNATSLPNGHGS
ncbi:hypothetical protein [Qipengyuania sp.]|uniref:hypothetical protein n=1 Tax=Qipengyuania sp. TaxID=2004515 RepID=UPI003BAAC181